MYDLSRTGLHFCADCGGISSRSANVCAERITSSPLDELLSNERLRLAASVGPAILSIGPIDCTATDPDDVGAADAATIRENADVFDLVAVCDGASIAALLLFLGGPVERRAFEWRCDATVAFATCTAFAFFGVGSSLEPSHTGLFPALGIL